MPEHIVSEYDAELETLRSGIAEMGKLVHAMIADATQALARRDFALAQAVISSDARVDALQREIEGLAILTIARRQPMAVDLREVVSALRIAGDLERVGDLAKNTSKRVVAINNEIQSPNIVLGIEHISSLAQAQIRDVLDAFSRKDDALALKVWRQDDRIDALCTSLFRELLTYMMEDARNISFCAQVLFLAKNIERIGDHATNIAETVHYLVTGDTLDIERPKTDTTTFTAAAANIG